MTDQANTGETAPTDSHVRPFADLLRELSKGATHEQLGTELAALVRRVQDTGKKGTLTLTITIEPPKGGGGQVMLYDDVKSKLPDFARQATIMFAKPSGDLTREDPTAVPFETMRVIDGDPGHVNLREAGNQ